MGNKDKKEKKKSRKRKTAILNTARPTLKALSLMKSRGYRQIKQVEHDEEDRKKQRAELAEKISVKLHALMWIIAAVCTIYFSKFFQVIFEDNRVER